MKRILSFSFVVLLLLSGLFLYNGKGYDHVIDSAKLVSYSSADEVVENSDLVVVVNKLSDESVSYDLGDNHFDNFTLSKVEIKKIIKPSENKILSKGDVIEILESEWVDEEAKVVHHLENYKKMEKGKSYTLYLGYNEEVDNYYPIGLVCGKIPSDANEKMFYGDFQNTQALDVVEELKKIK
ncbi:hypothetical protein [Petrocella sp. FN5]|uniref:hypothetical protein n=1 Tax=Petrocella sp. FN5 TaxID=3032002 RepID=UPI0023D98795|nr:hypothetical protein [Petrocella sp. FN5]MDF1617918.1 hypothetical protein [Petrocella sp. FN5]